MLLLWIGIKLLLPEHEEAHGNIQASDKLWAAVKTVIVADFVMSLDNVIAIAGAAEGAGGDHKMLLVIFGLLVSIPIIVWGSQLVIKLMDRFPVIITLGGMLLGWIAGQMVITDPVAQGLGRRAERLPALRCAGGRRAGVCWSSASGWPRASVRARAAPRRPRPRPAAVAGPGCSACCWPSTARTARRSAARYLIGRAPVDARTAKHWICTCSTCSAPVSGDVSRFVAGEASKDYHRERSEKALAPARALLDAAGHDTTRSTSASATRRRPSPKLAQSAGLRPDRHGHARPRQPHRRLDRLGGARHVAHASVPVLLVK